MARKKKIDIAKDVDEKSQENIEDNILNNPHNAITYKGKVTIKYVDNKGKIHERTQYNSGKIGLFTSLVRALAGKSITQYIPRSLQGYYTDSQGNAIQAFTNSIPYRGEPQAYNKGDQGKLTVNYGKCQVIEYIFLVPRSQFISSSQSISKLRLLNNIKDTSDPEISICAEINLADGETLPMNLDSNLLVYWQLEFINEKSTDILTK